MSENEVRLPPPTEEVDRETLQHQSIIQTYIYALLMFGVPGERKPPPLGSAVLMRSKNHLFAITAAHNFDHTDPAICNTAGKCFRPRILNKWDNPKLDLSILELEDKGDMQACSISQLDIRIPRPVWKKEDITAESYFWMLGFPYVWAEVENGVLQIKYVFISTNLARTDPEYYELFYYEQGYARHGQADFAMSDLPSSPGGFSGTGLWNITPITSDKLFNPLTDIRLCGIQKTWLPKSRRVRCVAARHIFDLLKTEYKDMHEELDQIATASELS